MIENDTKILLALSYIKGVGRKFLIDLARTKLNSGGDLLNYYKAKRSVATTEDELAKVFELAEQQIKIADEYQHQIISILDKEYPLSLKVINDPPVILFCNGNIDLLSKPSVSIIGTREPTAHGKLIASRVTNSFVEQGWVITSGLAKGIDTIAHQSCLDASGKTISILAQGLEKVYPAENKKLAQQIVHSDGLLISEYKYNSYVGKSNFVERDRIQAGIAKAVILVQSDLKGGSLHASRAAIKYQRFLVVLGQSKTDIKNNESKIQANQLLIERSSELVKDILKIKEIDFEYLIPLHNKNGFEHVNNKISRLEIKPFETKNTGTQSLLL